MSKGVISMGVTAPIIREGDDLKNIVVDAILDATAVYNNGYDFSNDEPFWYDIQDKDVIGITESVVARAYGNYVTVDDIVQFLGEHNFSKSIALVYPIMSRNRFSIILRAFARYADNIYIITEANKTDEVGNPTTKPNPFTGVDVLQYYKDICEQEHCRCVVDFVVFGQRKGVDYINAMCHPEHFTEHFSESLEIKCNLSQIMNEPVVREDGSESGYNLDFGLLGSNKADEERLKLFPDKEQAQKLCEDVQDKIYCITGKKLEVMVYGDGCFKDPIVGIWEFADPVTSPGYTKGLKGTPNEIKVKYFADSKYKDLHGEELEKSIQKEIEENKGKNLVGNMTAEGTTPRRYVDLLASLMDLTTGSGSRCTPIVLVKNYFN